MKAALPDMQAVLPPDVHISYEFDQSPYVTRAIWGVVGEGALGAMLVGLMILLFLRDWRSAIIVLLNIPLALMAAVVALWLTGQTINLMTLGGLALAIGILVDEATVEIENIHTPDGSCPVNRQGRAVWGTRKPPSRGSWRWSASWPCSFPRSSCKARPGDVRALVAGRRLLDGGLVPAFEHVGPRALGLAVAPRASRRVACTRIVAMPAKCLRRLAGSLVLLAWLKCRFL